MPGYSEQLSQQFALVDQILFTNAAAASYNSTTGVDLSKYKRALFVIQVAAITATATLDARLQGSNNSNFSGATNIANTNIAQITTANISAKIEIRSDQTNFRYVRINSTVGTTALNYGAMGFGGQAIQSPGSQGEVSTLVGQTVLCTP